LNRKVQNIVFLLLCFTGFGSFSPSFGQATGNTTVSIELYRVTIMDIEPNNNVISLPLKAPVEAGLPAHGETENATWLNYTCCLESGDADRIITVNIGNGTVPAGLKITVTASAYSGTGSGTFGTPSGTITLSSLAQTLISGIRGAYTGNGINNGHQLTYNLEITNYSQLDFDNSNTIQVVYTITN